MVVVEVAVAVAAVPATVHASGVHSAGSSGFPTKSVLWPDFRHCEFQA